MQLASQLLRFSRRTSSGLRLREDSVMLGVQTLSGKYNQEMKEPPDYSLVLLV